ncbi:MAG: hypothetical protein WDN06_14245 [Asticcacaulis sp.]
MLALSACTLAPHYERPAAPVAARWPVDAPVSAGQLKWRDLFLDPALQQTIQLALDNNRDLRVAALKCPARPRPVRQRARQSPAVRRRAAPRAPSRTPMRLQALLVATAKPTPPIWAWSWEIDLFGRVQSLNKAAKEDFFAAQENRNAVSISLISSVARPGSTMAADRDALGRDATNLHRAQGRLRYRRGPGEDRRHQRSRPQPGAHLDGAGARRPGRRRDDGPIRTVPPSPCWPACRSCPALCCPPACATVRWPLPCPSACRRTCCCNGPTSSPPSIA